jgi:ABC-type sugar transport system permease subunit
MVFYRYAFGGAYFGESSLGFGSSISVTMFLIILTMSMLVKGSSQEGQD